jgi:hypothetical protein
VTHACKGTVHSITLERETPLSPGLQYFRLNWTKIRREVVQKLFILNKWLFALWYGQD